MKLLIILILAVHLLCMNAASAGPLLATWLDWRERRGHWVAGRAGRFLATTSLVLYLMGIVLGLALAWLVWSGAFWREFNGLLPSRIYFGMWELLFSAALLIVIAAWWRWAPGGTIARLGRSVLAAATATNLMYHFPPLFVVAATLSAGEGATLGPIDNGAFRRLIWQGEVFALTIHFWLASFAVAAVLLAAYAAWSAGDVDSPDQEAARLAAWGGRLALFTTLLQIPVGLWLTMELPLLRQNRVMGADLGATTLLAAGVLAALALMHVLASISLGDARRRTVFRAVLLMLAVIVLMTAALRQSRPPEASLGNENGPQGIYLAARKHFKLSRTANCRPTASHLRFEAQPAVPQRTADRRR